MCRASDVVELSAINIQLISLIHALHIFSEAFFFVFVFYSPFLSFLRFGWLSLANGFLLPSFYSFFPCVFEKGFVWVVN